MFSKSFSDARPSLGVNCELNFSEEKEDLGKENYTLLSTPFSRNAGSILIRLNNDRKIRSRSEMTIIIIVVAVRERRKTHDEKVSFLSFSKSVENERILPSSSSSPLLLHHLFSIGSIERGVHTVDHPAADVSLSRYSKKLQEGERSCHKLYPRCKIATKHTEPLTLFTRLRHKLAHSFSFLPYRRFPSFFFTCSSLVKLQQTFLLCDYYPSAGGQLGRRTRAKRQQPA